MTVYFTFEKEDSTASSLYKTVAKNENGEVLMTWQIACDDESQLQTIAEESYLQSITPLDYSNR
jgi:hypothetical protein